ncbi:hypothetical protein Pan54_35730 [Rubinisphaera italica]|uniref:Leucine Rich repeats (2 copies) n=2 Tax=Rubinisphaera italica TaxID=2527969 RepID=A0A5C5XI86_9PLAN|nr:hypothetical protein Pan54_35730 [Rubinisphaera italica]
MTNVTDAGVAKLKNLTRLRHLRLSYTGITDTGMKYLDSFPILELLELRDTRVTQRAIADFMRSHPRCKVTPP